MTTTVLQAKGEKETNRTILYTLFLFLFSSIFMGLHGYATPEYFSLQPHDHSSSQHQASFLSTPLSFEANHGQTDSQVKFLSRGKGYSLYLTPDEAILALTKAAPSKPVTIDTLDESDEATRAVLRMRLVGANPSPAMTGEKALPGKVNYFIGNDATKWQTDVPTYARTRYTNVYPGIDLIYYGNQGQLEYDFVVAPGADPKAIRLQFEGSDHIALDNSGNLLLHFVEGTVRLQKPIIYQVMGESREEIKGKFVIHDTHKLSFEVAAYDTRRPLIIDPVLSYSTYLGGSASEGGNLAIDTAGNMYVLGSTTSVDFPTVNPIQATKIPGSSDLFIAKLNAQGSALVFSTYLGGDSQDSGGGIAVDGSGNIFVTGFTNSTNFPVTAGAFQPSGFIDVGSGTAFVTKIDSTGSSLAYSSYLGGSDGESGRDIVVDNAGNAYVTGSTSSSDFPIANPIQPIHAGGLDVFVTKVNATGTGLIYSTYLGGMGLDVGNAIALDSNRNIYVTGNGSKGGGFPTTETSFQPESKGGFGDFSEGFVTKLNPDGSTLIYSTYLGGTERDAPKGIAVDVLGQAYVAGFTFSADFPITVGVFQPTKGILQDGFITKLNTDGSALVYSSFLGGSVGPGTDGIDAIEVDEDFNAYVTGITLTSDFPTVAAIQPFRQGREDAFVSKINPQGSALIFSTYLGGGGNESGNGIAVDGEHSIYVAGRTSSVDFPTEKAFQGTFGGDQDVFVTKIEGVGDTPPPNQAPTVDAGPPQTITLPNFAALDGTVTDDGLPSGTVTTMWSKVSGPGTVTLGNATAVDTTASFSLPGTYVLRLTADDGELTASDQVPITVNPQPVVTVPDIRGTWTGGPYSVTLTGCQDPDNNGVFFDPGGGTYSITDQTGANFSFTIVVSESDSGDTVEQTTTCSGTIAANGAVTASCTYSVKLNGGFWYSGADTITGSLAGNTWTYTGAGQDLVGDTCQYNYSTTTDTRSGPVPPPIVVPINQMPSVSAGSDKTIAFPNFAFLDGTVTDDGLPSGTVTTMWSKVSGPGTVTFGNPNAVDTTVTFSQVGTYVLGLTANDGLLQAFDDLTITVTAATPGEPTLYDLNGDGKADIVWRNTANGAVAAWLMSGLALGPTGILAGVPTNWIIAGIGDVDGDEKADIVWRDTDTGDVAVWLGNGVNPPTTTGIIAGALPLDWKIVGVGDVNGDGTADIILRNTNTGDVAVWLGNGVDPPTTTGIIAGALPLDWKIVGVGDVNGDGTADIILRNTNTGDVAVWLGNGVNPPTTTGIIVGALALDWIIAGIGDVDGDGTADIILRNTDTGDVAVWLGNGVDPPTTTGVIASGVPLDWTIAEIGDVDDDGTADIIWRNTDTGDVAVWLGNGVNPPTTTGVIADGVPLEWEIRPFEFQPEDIGSPFT